MHVSSPEDTILAKLRWAKLSGAGRLSPAGLLRAVGVILLVAGPAAIVQGAV